MLDDRRIVIQAKDHIIELTRVEYKSGDSGVYVDIWGNGPFLMTVKQVRDLHAWLTLTLTEFAGK